MIEISQLIMTILPNAGFDLLRRLEDNILSQPIQEAKLVTLSVSEGIRTINSTPRITLTVPMQRMEDRSYSGVNRRILEASLPS